MGSIPAFKGHLPKSISCLLSSALMAAKPEVGSWFWAQLPRPTPAQESEGNAHSSSPFHLWLQHSRGWWGIGLAIVMKLLRPDLLSRKHSLIHLTRELQSFEAKPS